MEFDSENCQKVRINVYAIDEYISFSNYFNRKEFIKSNLLRRVTGDEKSRYALFRKLSKLIEERLNIFMKLSPQKASNNKTKIVMIIFIVKII